MEELQPRSTEVRLPISNSPRRLTHSRKRRTESDPGDEILKVQLDTANKRIAELESELQVAKQSDARSRRRLVELRAKYVQNYEAFVQRMSKPKPQLQDTMTAVASENMASVALLHSQLQQEIGLFQTRTEQKLKSKELLIQQNFEARLKLFGRQKEHKGAPGDSSPANTDLNLEQQATQLRQFEDFNSKLQASNKALRQKLKEVQAVAEVYADQHAAILLENARLKRILQEKNEPPQSHRSSITDEFPQLSRSRRSNSETGKVAELQRELGKLRGQLIEERSKRSEAEEILEKCLEEARSGQGRSELSSREWSNVRSRLSEELLRMQAFANGRSASVTTLRN